MLLEAGGDDDVLEVMEAGKWPLNLGSERDWSFQSQQNANLNGRSIHLAMGKVLGGGSSINWTNVFMENREGGGIVAPMHEIRRSDPDGLRTVRGTVVHAIATASSEGVKTVDLELGSVHLSPHCSTTCLGTA
jgi:hypothetical protein